ncbi:MAG: Spo0B domain-containing protein [Candidatus Pristimantibacillus sp.]
MDRIKTAKQSAAASIVLPCAAVLIWPSSVWLLALFLVWLTTAAAVWIWAERREHAERLARTVHTMQASGIRTLNHHRHDWMNDLQVIYGYIRMNKPDKAVEYVDKIRERMIAESQIAKLGVPSLVSYIQSFRTLTNSLQLHVKIAQDINLNELPIDSLNVAETLMQIINTYRFAVKTGYGDPASLTMEMTTDGQVLFAAFYYQGELTDEQQLTDKLKQQLEGAPLQPVDLDRPQETILLKSKMRV